MAIYHRYRPEGIGLIMVWNRLSDRNVSRIIVLHRQGLSYPSIARKLKVNRETVGRYVRKLNEPTRVISVALYSSDLKRLERQANKQNKSASDIIRGIIHERLRQR